MEPIIEFKNITKSYGDNVVVKDLNLTIDKGAFITIIGSSGCGKTTTLKMINRLITPDSGEILIDGENIENRDVIKLRRNIGYSIQGNVLFPHLTVRDNIAYVPELSEKIDKEKLDKEVRELMKIVNLDEKYIDYFPHELSGGQAQRVGLARALASKPRIMLLDEPFGAVDAITRTQLQKEIKKIHEESNITFIFVTHDINEAVSLGDKVIIMEDGQIDQYDTPEKIVNEPATEFAKTLIGDKSIIKI